MPSVGTGAMLANQKLIAIGISGDGDTGAIGIGQFVHLMRRNLPIIYIIEDNGCYGLTKGQFSPTADLGSKLKNGVVNDLPPIDTCALALELGATFVGRSFSGDKKQLLSLLKAALSHRGTVMLDVISPCVTFNDHEGSTKSYAYAKDHDDPVEDVTFVPFFEDIAVDYEPGTTQEVTMHDGSKLLLEEARGRLRPDGQDQRACGVCTRRRGAASSPPASSTSSRTGTISSRSSTSSTSRWRRFRSSAFARAGKRSTTSWKGCASALALRFVLVRANAILRGSHRRVRHAVLVHARPLAIAVLFVSGAVTFDGALVDVLIANVFVLRIHRFISF